MPDSRPAYTEFHLTDYWRIVMRRRWFVILFSLVVIITTAVETFLQEKEYQANVVMHINMNAPRVVDFEDPNTNSSRGMNWDYQSFYNTQVQIIHSRTVQNRVIEKLKALGYPEWKNHSDPFAKLNKNMQVSPVRETQLLKIEYIDTDPQKAAVVANTIADVYIEENLNRKLKNTQLADKWLQDQSKVWLIKKRESDETLLSYKKDNDLLSLEEKSSAHQKNLADIFETYNKARADRIAAESEVATLQRLLSQKKIDYLTTYFQSETIQKLKEQLHDVEKQYQALAEKYKELHPEMQKLKAERSILSENIEKEVSRLTQGRITEFNVKRAKEISLQKELERVKKQTGEFESKLVKAQELMNDSDRNDRFFKQLDKRQAETDLVGLLRNSNLEIIDHAVAPTIPIYPNVKLNILFAIFVSVIGGIAIAMLVEYFDKTFKTPEELEQYMNAQVLGILPTISNDITGAKRDMFVHLNPKSSVAECARLIRTNIFWGNNEDKHIHALLITSGSPREGKSTVAVSISITMAQAHNKTLLVDTDLRRPRLHKIFGRDLSAGLTSLLNNELDYDKVIFETEIPGMYIMPAGPIPPNPSELLGSTRMDEIIKELRARFDRVIFDSPPCIAVTDPVVLANKVDGLVFVVKQGTTLKEATLEARRRLADVREKLLGCVLNSVSIDHGGYGYKYYYYHYYHYYGEDEDKQPTNI